MKKYEKIKKLTASSVLVQIIWEELVKEKSIKGSMKDIKQFEAVICYSLATQKPQF